MQKPRVFLLHPNAAPPTPLPVQLSAEGFEVLLQDGEGNLLGSRSYPFPDAVIICASTGSERQAIASAQHWRDKSHNLPIVLLVERSSESLAIAALRAGISDYFRHPFDTGEIVFRLKRLLRVPVTRQRAQFPRALMGGERLIGISRAMQSIKACLPGIAATNSTVLLTGETGTGKELIAELIHQNSDRSAQPFVRVNCAALPEMLLESELFGFERGAFTGAVARQIGKFEQANGGTLLLDEIGEMSERAQAKLLRVLESRELFRVGGQKAVRLNVRLIAATNQNLESLITEKRFRPDLYYRLNVARVHLPPLRERKEDIPILLDFYLKHYCRAFGREVKGFTKEVIALLSRYDWPGNIRELKNVCEATLINLPAGPVSLADLPPLYRQKLQEFEGLPISERERLLEALFATNWNVSKAAKKLRWSRMTVYRKIGKYHISRPQ